MPQTKSRVPYLFEIRIWRTIYRRIRDADDIRLFLDFDGTLTPICPTPEDVKLRVPVRQILERLSRHPRVHVALLSGRRNSALRRYVQVPHIQLLGLYGSEKEGRLILPASTRSALPRLRSVLRPFPAKFPGIRVEEKGVSFAIHFRGASPAAARNAQAWIRELLPSIRDDFRVLQSHSAWEIVPRLVKGKGHALRAVVKEIPAPFLPIYIGDDLTDEPAFTVAKNGITIRVGPASPTHAHFRLSDPNDVYKFLERLETELS